MLLLTRFYVGSRFITLTAGVSTHDAGLFVHVYNLALRYIHTHHPTRRHTPSLDIMIIKNKLLLRLDEELFIVTNNMRQSYHRTIRWSNRCHQCQPGWSVRGRTGRFTLRWHLRYAAWHPGIFAGRDR